MNISEAFSILGINKSDSQEDRKRKYRRLMMLHHPDVTGDDSAFMSQKINAAYEYIRSHPNESPFREAEAKWDAAINPKAFCERCIFVDYSFLDKRIPIHQVAEGRYLWDPYIEDFKMLARSVAILTADLIQDHPYSNEAVLFHMLMQEYVEPISCAKKIGLNTDRAENGNIYTFSGEVGISYRKLLMEIETGEQSALMYAAKRSQRIVIHDEHGKIYGDLSYNDDSLYYVVNPLIGNPCKGIGVNIVPGILHKNRRDLNYEGKLDVSIEIEISDTAVFDIPVNSDKIKKLLSL